MKCRFHCLLVWWNSGFIPLARPLTRAPATINGT